MTYHFTHTTSRGTVQPKDDAEDDDNEEKEAAGGGKVHCLIFVLYGLNRVHGWS